MRNLQFQWLISGHLNEEKALEICQEVKNCIKYNEISADDITPTDLMIKMPDKSVHDVIHENEIPDGDITRVNPNSCI